MTRDWQINELAEIVATGDPTLLRTLWSTVVDADKSMASAVYQANRSVGRHVFGSQLAQQLTTTAWILDRYGELKRPRQVSFEQLRDGWKQPSANSLLHKLGFGAHAAQLEQLEAAKPFYAEQLGIEVEDAELLKEAHAVGITSDDLRELIAQRPGQPEVSDASPQTRALYSPSSGERTQRPSEGYTPLCDAVGGCGKRRREPLRRQMRPVSWAHMATSTRFRAPSFRMRLARWALTVLGVM